MEKPETVIVFPSLYISWTLITSVRLSNKLVKHLPPNICLFKVNNRNTENVSQICSKLTKKMGRGGRGVPFLKFQGKSYSCAYFTPKIKITEFILQRKVKYMVDETILENTEAEKGFVFHIS